MLDAEILKSVAAQLMSKTDEEAPRRLKIFRTGRQRLRMARFTMNGREYEAIEQNATKPTPLGATGAGRASGCAVQRC